MRSSKKYHTQGRITTKLLGLFLLEMPVVHTPVYGIVNKKAHRLIRPTFHLENGEVQSL